MNWTICLDGSMNTIKVLGISGSPVKNGNTDRLVKEMVTSLGGGDIVLLREKKIMHCTGCMKCGKAGSCHLKDGMQGVYRKMDSADVIVFGSPSYYDNVSGMMKMLIDRSVPYYTNKKLHGKKAIIITVGEETAKEAIPALKCACEYNGMKVAGTLAVISKSGKIQDSKKVFSELDKIARKMRV